MNPYKISNTFHPVGILFVGLLIAQIIAFIQVYLSNLDLYETVSAVNTAGYLAIPNERVMKGLQELRPAFFGGLFFTFSIGAGISLGSMAAAWLWARLFLRNKYFFLLLLSVWVGFMVLVNIHGITLIPTLYFLFIPPAIFTMTAKWASHTDIQLNRIQRLVHLIPIPLLALLWFTQFDNEMFLDLRDNLLLSNFYGKKFSNFYYTNTLYPAEAFKSLDQKIIKTCRLEDIQDRSLHVNLKNKLIANDYLPLSDATEIDLKIIQKGEKLTFEANKRRMFHVEVNQFLLDSKKVLQRFSAATDRYATFRQITFLSLLIGFPLLIYLVFHAFFYYPAFLFLSRKRAALAASIMCLLIGLGVLFYFQSHRSGNIRIKNISEALKSGNLQTRVAALKIVQQKKLEIAGFRAYPVLLKSPIPQERYWLARALAVSRRSNTYDDLLTFMNDNNTNVRTMAFYSLGLRKNPQAVKPILEIIENSDDWYTQMYAYNALRALGWKQTKSP